MEVGFSIWILVKAAFIFAFFIYTIFAAVVVRQVYLMTDTIHAGFETELRGLAWAHFALALGIVLLSFLVL